MNLETLLENHLAAVGGRDYLATLHSVWQRGKLKEGHHDPIAFEVLKMRPNLLKVLVANGAFVEGFDGVNAWEKKAFAPAQVVTGSAADALSRAAELPSAICSLEDFRERGHSIEFAGEEVVEGIHYFVLLLTFKDGHGRRYYVHPETYYLERVRDIRPLHPGEEQKQIETLSYDFRMVQGIPVAFQNAEHSLKTGEILLTIEWEEIELNPEVSVADFQLPNP